MTTLKTEKLQEIADRWDAVAKRRKAISGDQSLSMIGQKRAFEALEKERDRLVTATLEAVKAVDAALRRDYLANKKQRGAALEASRSRWGKTGLELAIRDEIDRARALIARGKDDEIRRAWEDVKDSGAFTYAWLIATRDNAKAGIVRSEVLQQYGALENTMPEMEAVNRRGSEITQRGEALRADLITLMSMFGSGAFNPATAQLQEIMSRLHIERRNEYGQDVITFEYLEPSQTGFFAFVVPDDAFGSTKYDPAK